MRFLLDINVLSELTRPAPDPGVIDRLSRHELDCCTAAPVLHELHYGVGRLPEGRRRATLQLFLATVVSRLDVRPYDDRAARWHGAARASLAGVGRTPSFVDGQVAAIAAVENLTVVTRNTLDFEGFDVELACWHDNST